MRWASRKTETTWARSAFSGVSAGISMLTADARDAVEARGLKLETEDLFEIAFEILADLVDVLAGIFLDQV